MTITSLNARNWSVALACVVGACTHPTPADGRFPKQRTYILDSNPLVIPTLSACPTNEMRVVRVEVRRDVLDPVLDGKQGWNFRAYHVVAPRTASIDVAVEDGRSDDMQLLSGRPKLIDGKLDLLLGFCISQTANVQPSDGSVVVLWQALDNCVVQLIQSSLTPTATPSLKAVRAGWLDNGSAVGATITVPLPLRSTCLIDTISWNGLYSSEVAHVMSPKYHGTFTIATNMAEDVKVRTNGLLPEWPEPVWFIRLRSTPQE